MADVKPTDEQNYPHMWEDKWVQKNTHWDQGRPHDFLVQFLNSPDAAASGVPTSGRAFVPGCGQGYDVDLFARRGLDSVGLDVAPTGVTAANKWLDEAAAKEPRKASAKVVLGDFFKDEPEEKFDLIYDYTFLCALPPTLRPAWGKRMTELSKAAPGTRLVTLQYPLHGNPPPFGPPFSLEESVYEDVLGDDWEQVWAQKVPDSMRREGPPGDERLVVWKRKL